MSRPPYTWFEAYEIAVFETDFSKLATRIEAALTQIEKRLDRKTTLDEAEFDELQKCLHSLQALSAQSQSA
jgi:hypothetical protein